MSMDDKNLATVGQRGAYRIIMTGFGIVGSLAALYLVYPGAEPAQTIVTATITGIFGFLAGRKT